MSTIAIVTVNFRNAEVTMACLDSLAIAGGEGIRIFLIENGSDDGSSAKLATYAANSPLDIDFMDMGENLGFAGGSNQGISAAQKAGCDPIVLLNNDTRVEKGFTQALRGIAVRHPGAVVAGYIENLETGGPAHNLGRIGTWTSLVEFIFPHRHDPHPAFDFVSAALMVVPAEVFRRLGTLRRDFFLYCEDLDFCLRLKDAGVPLRYDPALAIAHHVSATVSKTAFPKHYYRMRNQTYIAMRRGSILAKAAYLARALAALAGKVGHPGLFRQFQAGIQDGLVGRLGHNPEARA